MSLRLITHILLSLMLLVSATVSQARGLCSDGADMAAAPVSDMPCHQAQVGDVAPESVPDHSHINCLCCSGAVGATVSVSVIADHVSGPDAFVIRAISLRSDPAHRTPLQRPPIV